MFYSRVLRTSCSNSQLQQPYPSKKLLEQSAPEEAIRPPLPLKSNCRVEGVGGTEADTPKGRIHLRSPQVLIRRWEMWSTGVDQKVRLQTREPHKKRGLSPPSGEKLTMWHQDFERWILNQLFHKHAFKPLKPHFRHNLHPSKTYGNSAFRPSSPHEHIASLPAASHWFHPQFCWRGGQGARITNVIRLHSSTVCSVGGRKEQEP